ncbi:MAG: HAMP domain-containing protein [Nitrospirales bacterium]|nr:HAMP domain-containing protein [Nitrospirales bacterium]
MSDTNPDRVASSRQRKNRVFFPSPYRSLRTKLVVFLSLVIMTTCTGLSWYFIQNKTTDMTDQLVRLGNILVKNLASNSRFALFTEDTLQLQRFIEGVMEVEEVVYVMITSSEGSLLARASKGMLKAGNTLVRDKNRPLYPDTAITHSQIDSLDFSIKITSFQSTAHAGLQGIGATPVLDDQGESAGLERLHNFAFPVIRQSPNEASDNSPLGPLLLGSEGKGSPENSHSIREAKVYGVIHVGVTESLMQQVLKGVIYDIGLLTLAIIVFGITATIWMAGRIITPLSNLAYVAQRVAVGDLTATADVTTRDEVGQLTAIFNQMTHSLQDRDEAISLNIGTIQRQLRQLQALNQTSTAITSTLDLDKLFTTVLQLLIEQVGFGRMLLVLYDETQGVALLSRVSGVPLDIEARAKQIKIPVQDDGSIEADLLIHKRPLLVPDLHTIRHRMFPPFLAVAEQIGITSLVGVPLQSKSRVLGYLVADKASHPCAQEDLDLLTTIASHVAVAIDNANAYQELGTLTHNLERRVLERTQALQIANEKLRELDRLKSGFVSIVSHELRTPMTSIKGYIENMLDGLAGALTPKQQYYLQRLLHNSERLTRMINELLDLSRIETGQVSVTLAPLAIQDVVQEVTEELQVQVVWKGVDLQVSQGDLLPLVMGDHDKLHRVLSNLVQNAITFTQAEGRIMIEVREGTEEFVQVSVQDTGCGIFEEEQQKVFLQFYRGKATPAAARGAGLGLAITKHLVELQGGTIGVESQVGKGSTFTFTIPLYKGDGTAEVSLNQ